MRKSVKKVEKQPPKIMIKSFMKRLVKKVEKQLQKAMTKSFMKKLVKKVVMPVHANGEITATTHNKN